MAARLVLGGSFQQAGTAVAGNLAALDPTTRAWSSLGASFNDEVSAVASAPNGVLYAGGSFFHTGSGFATSVARWDGVAWQPLAQGLDNKVTALLVMPNGDLIAGGYFTSSGATPLARIARWNGSSWSPLGTGTNGVVTALALAANGDLVAGGWFTVAGGVAANRVARWDGSSWAALGSGVGGPVASLAIAANGDIYCGGSFASAGGAAASDVARWDGAAWHPLGSGMAGALHEVSAVAVLANGDVVAGGRFLQAGGVQARGLARWDGAGWHEVGGGVSLGQNPWGPQVSAVVSMAGDLWIAGRFDRAGGKVALGVARWDGSNWSRSNEGIDRQVTRVMPLAAGGFVAGGSFRTIEGIDTPCVARFDGTQWHALGAGLGGLSDYEYVSGLLELPSGDLLMTGLIYVWTSPTSIAPGAAAWRFDGTSWSPLPGAVGVGHDLERLADGRIAVAADVWFSVAGGGSVAHIAAWNGTGWQAMGAAPNGPVRDLQSLPNGDLVASGEFTQIGGVFANRVARWNGTSWSAMGAGFGSRAFLAVRPNGELMALRENNATLYRWTGASWQDLGAITGWNYVSGFAALPDGDLVAAAAGSAGGVRRWNGSTWSALAPLATFGGALSVLPQGIAFAGQVQLPTGQASSALSLFVSTCPASAVASGAGCAGSAGVPQYAATALPWLGATFRGRAAALPASCLAVQATSLGGAISMPLPAELLPSAPSCTLFVAPDAVAVQLANGTADTSLAIPDTAALLGITFRDQIVALELDGGGSLLQSSTSNALVMTVGTY